MADGQQPFMMSTFALEGSDAAASGADDNSPASKKRRTGLRGPRACDTCRQKKIRCNASPDSPKCLHCISIGVDCQYTNDFVRKPAPSKGSKAYTEALEQRVAFLEKALLENQGSSPHSASPTPPPSVTAMSPLSTLYAASADEESLEEPEDELAGLSEHMHRMGIKGELTFFGKASGIFLIHQVLGMRRDMHQSPGRPHLINTMRNEFWEKPSWEQALENKVNIHFNFPPPELMASLVNHYFVNANAFMPLLHRPTFEYAIREGKHLEDQGFAATLLLACAIGSRYSDDPRVRLDDCLDNQYSAGWKYFVQVPPMEVSPMSKPSRYELQKCILMVFFMMGSSSPRGCWTLVGTGLRFAQDLGIHRRRMSDMNMTRADHEQWKRIFWCLVCLDRMYAMGMGRSVALQDEDIDTDLPLPVDDEYWFNEDGAEHFQQPPNKPSKILFFNAWIQLLQIISFSLRTVKTKIRMGLSPDKIVEVVAEMDSALNRWFDMVPDHLRWDPHRENQVFFSQSVVLHSWFYNLQILTHRHFLLTPRGGRDDGVQTFPSLAICTNAARTILHISHRQVQRGGYGGMSLCFMNVLSAAVVLYLNLWSSRNPRGPTSSHNAILPDVQKAREIMIFMEKRFFAAGRSLDILMELGSVVDMPTESGPSAKRQRDTDAVSSQGSPSQGSDVQTTASSSSGNPSETLPLNYLQLGGMPFDLGFVSSPQRFAAFEPNASMLAFDPTRQPLNTPLHEQANPTKHLVQPVRSVDPLLADVDGAPVLPGTGSTSPRAPSGYVMSHTTNPTQFGDVFHELDSVAAAGGNVSDIGGPLHGLSQPQIAAGGRGLSAVGAYKFDLATLDATANGRVGGFQMAGMDGRAEEMWNMGSMSLWPTGMESEDWSQYLTNVNEWTHAASSASPSNAGNSGERDGVVEGTRTGWQWTGQAP
ncbi:hypothetical protein CYLTODRAFT_419255 [Cylindrobasidium torrendii FP15055 ss-10]|uniref:Zn(2)-C6 fungal-type domain-containing protein n=1 Tax=Cylindrobasidium torrendii FP15055 ss-10 TaxID=1314674 RepID=A0A0D7BKB0_9AGAR|nr:hypothetical protein CYLTODRAFT_419255 [Cylindrobasidium torrendii FP15055 ss-10]